MLRHKYVKFVNRLNITILILIHVDYTFFTGVFSLIPKETTGLGGVIDTEIRKSKRAIGIGKVKMKQHDNPWFSSKRKVVFSNL